MQKRSFEVFADYHQFYLWDEEIAPEAPIDWSDDDVAHRLKAAPNVVVVCPVRNMTVPVEVELHDTEPTYNIDAWDHIAECSLDLPSGKLQIHECTGGAVGSFQTNPGTYRVRHSTALLEVSARMDSMETTTTLWSSGPLLPVVWL